MGSLAQEEARFISENVTWGHHKRFADGKVTVPYTRFLGYDKGGGVGLVINPEQAKTVRRIYNMHSGGMSIGTIVGTLTDEPEPLTAAGARPGITNPYERFSPTGNTRVTPSCRSRTSLST